MSEVDPNALLWDLMRGAMATKAFGTVVDLGVADVLADGARPVSEIAAETGADSGTLHRIMRALASDGVFAEEEPGFFRNTEASELFRRDRENSWPEFAHLFGGVFYDAIAGLDPHTTEPTFERGFGSGFWPWLEANPPERAAFDAAMAGGKEQTADLLAGLDWRGDETIVDVGGGNGALLRALFNRVQGMSGIVFDLPETKRDSSLGERIEFVAGSFFEHVPAGHAYVLSRILHDWNDEKAAAILRVIREAAPDDARLLVLDNVVPPGNEPNGAKWLDLLMLVLAGGRERSEPDWRALLEGAGFAVEQIEDGLIQARCR
jgi:O-methyltransferase/methyltransferase family protein